jgi:hypothetical protein
VSLCDLNTHFCSFWLVRKTWHCLENVPLSWLYNIDLSYCMGNAYIANLRFLNCLLVAILKIHFSSERSNGVLMTILVAEILIG